MRFPIPANQLQFALYLTLETGRPTKLRIVTYDRDKPFTKYSDRFVNIHGRRTIYITYPQSPNWLVMQITNTDASRPNDFRVIGSPSKTGALIPYQVIPIRKCDVWMDEDTRKFVDFAELFSKNAGILQTSGDNYYADNSGKFKINFNDFIVDKQTKQMLNTPARIGHDTGTIYVSKQIFQDYTVPQRFLILLHEFSHKYINPKFGKAIDNEFSADINALYIYLGKGYPPIDARIVYAKVFNGVGVDANLSLKRLHFIEDFINKYKQNQFATCNKNYKV